jgi:hypothetical protein
MAVGRTRAFVPAPQKPTLSARDLHRLFARAAIEFRSSGKTIELGSEARDDLLLRPHGTLNPACFV